MEICDSFGVEILFDEVVIGQLTCVNTGELCLLEVIYDKTLRGKGYGEKAMILFKDMLREYEYIKSVRGDCPRSRVNFYTL